MYTLDGYNFTRTIYENANVAICRGTLEKENLPIIAKFLKADFPTPEAVNDLEYEFGIGKSLDIPGVVDYYSIEKAGYGRALIMEDFDAVSLDKYAASKPVPIKEFLEIAIKLSSTVGLLHRKNIIHKDLKPHNILINTGATDVKIIDFSISSRVQRENQAALSPVQLKGTPTYISPEQTGRMNRMVDYRTDYYSLGVTFYEMLTGHPPFEAGEPGDPMELVHAHIARKPTPPHRRNPDVPAALSNIVLKLMAKNAEERYQNSDGLVADLEECQTQLEEKGKISEFQVGTHDIPDRFLVPEILYGRQKELAALPVAFRKVAKGGKEIIFFSGPTGIGKSALINEIYRPVTAGRAFFIKGKYDQHEMNMPFRGIIRAFSGLVKQLLGENETQLEAWRERIKMAVESFGRVATDLIPGLELIIGEQPEVPKLPPAEARHRLHNVFRRLVKTFARKRHPLVLAMDDLQWADDGGLQLLEVLAKDPELNYFMLVGTYRSNADIADTSFINRFGPSTQPIFLDPLDKKDIAALLADTLHASREKTRELAELVCRKTRGNPFFIHEFLKKLYEDDLIEFNHKWTWDLTRIREAAITDNAAELVAGKLEKMPPETREILEIACCVGLLFPIDTIRQISKKEKNDIRNLLEPAVTEGILLITGNKGKFTHDRVREAVSFSMSEEKMRKQHYAIAGAISEKKRKKRNENRLFSLVGHLNAAGPILEPDEKHRLARLNYKAGRKTKAASANEAAYRFFSNGVKMLPADAWESDYELSYALYSECGEAGYLCGNHEDAETHLDEVLKRAKSPLEKTKAVEYKMAILNGRHQHGEAFEVGRKALLEIQFPLPSKNHKSTVISQITRIKFKMRKRQVEDLLELPEMTDPRQLAIVRLLSACIEPCYFVAPGALPLLVLKFLKFILKNGNCAHSAYVYVICGILLCDAPGNIDLGYRMGILALKILEVFDARELKARVFFLFACGISHWQKHLREGSEYVLEAFRSGVDVGDLPFASYSLLNFLYMTFFQGHPLLKVKNQYDHYYPDIRKLHVPGSIREFELWHQAVNDFIVNTGDGIAIKGNIADEKELMAAWKREGNTNRPGLFMVMKVVRLYFSGHFEKAVTVARKGDLYLDAIRGNILLVEYYFYYSLAMLAMYPRASKSTRRRYLKRIKSHVEKLKQWAGQCSRNFLAKYLLVEAELERVRGNVRKAVNGYSLAAEAAHESGFLHEEACANECAAKFYLAEGMADVAAVYMKKAHYLYCLWGAAGKVENLASSHPEIISSMGSDKEQLHVLPSTAATVTPTPGGANVILDTNAVLKASQAISGEIVMEKLLGKLTRIVMENAGAHKVLLFVKKDEILYLEAAGNAEEQQVEVLQTLPLERCFAPRSVIRYVERVRESVVLDDAAAGSFFTEDPYILNSRTKSVMCMPLEHQDSVTAILYLENNLSSGVFTPKRQETLKVLAAQMAVSLENAKLYNNLMQAEEKFRTFLETTNEGFLELDNQARVIDVNPELCSILGKTREALLGTSAYDLAPPEEEELMRRQAEIRNNGKSSTYELNMRRADDTKVHCVVNATPIFDKDGKKRGSFAMITDITQLEEKDRQLQQAQKMETVGTLAGGLAHDFNNVLGGIIGSLSLIRAEKQKEQMNMGEIEDYLEDIDESAHRAADIVKRLLSFSRKEELSFTAVDLNTSIKNVTDICRNTFDKSIHLEPVYSEKTAAVFADATQVEQVLLNLCVNAFHAMTVMRENESLWGGTLNVSLRLVNVNKEFRTTLNHAPVGTKFEDGSYWRLAVGDQGVGMEPERTARIFEPFFTTKKKTKGTGLGLTMVYNIIKQNKGFIDIDSQPGKGSTFSIYFPELTKNISIDKKKTVEEDMVEGQGLILVVDDEPIMRKIALKVLKDSGYEVIAAKDGQEGVEFFEKHLPRVKLVLLDMLMPKKSGKETYIEMKKLDPGIKVLLTSGFREDERVEEVLALGVNGFIEKPYTFTQLSKAVHEVLEDEPAST
ncbi:MAG: AAA family ATPase [bacterium]|nr:AAA family ATPase [bacterium]